MPFGTAPMGRRSGAPVLTEVQGTALALGESSWVRTIDRVVYRLLAVVLTLVLAGWLAQFAARVVEFPPWAAALLVLGLGLIALAVMGAVGFFAVAVSLIALVSALLAGQYWGMEFQGAPSNPALSFLAMACFVAACQPRRHWWVLAGLVPGVYIVVCGWVTHQPVRAVADVMATVPSGAIWWIMLTWLRDTAQEGDERRRAEMRARVEMAIARSEPSSEEEIRRFLHDELIAALATVAYADRIDGGEAAARAGCAAALAALEAEDDTPRGEGLDEASLRSLASEQGLDVEFSIEPGLDPTSINADILVQMRAAAAEAFRNVRRHAGTTRVRVDLRRQGGDGLCLDISDRGRGVNEFDQAGFGPHVKFDADELSGAVKKGLERALKDGAKLVEAATKRRMPARNGWMSLPNQGNYGNDYITRAGAAKGGYANLPEESVYPATFVDSKGDTLMGSKRYRLHFDPSQLPPNDAFWSLTVYDLVTMQFVDNELGRYSIGDRTPGLHTSGDGSLDIDLQHEVPAAGGSNWLPTPAGAFLLVVRIYQPKPEVLDGRYMLPPLETLE